MEVKPGYKQTEVGVIPGEWDEKPLHEGIKLLSGHHVLAQNCNTDGNGTPYITGPADFPDGTIRNSKFTEKPTTICHRDDILVTVKGSGVGTIVLADSEYCISRQLMAVRVTEWDTAYVHAFLRRDASLFGAAATGLIPGLSRGDILNKRIPIPPLPEQCAIAGALRDVDALIGALEQLIAKKRDLKQAAMQQLLTGQKRLPGFDNGLRCKHSEVGVIPEDWRVEAVGEISSVGRGRVISHREIAASISPLYPVYSSQTSENGIMGYLDTFDFEGECITWTTDGANAGTVFHRNGRFNCTNVCGTIKLKRDNAGFVSKVLAGIAPRYVSRNLGNPKLMNDVMKKVPVPLPPSIAEQTAIAEVLSDMDAELAALERRRDKTRALKQGMMQELLTGRTRLVDSPRSYD